MSGPLQFTVDGRFVPAIGVIPTAEPLEPEPKTALPPRPLPQSKKQTPKNILALAKARLKEVKTELRRLKALEEEKGELERLISAAENKPRVSNLREIKQNRG